VKFVLKNFLILILVLFLFVALGQWNHPNFQQKAYEKAKELIILDLREKGEKPGSFLEPPEYFAGLIKVQVVTAENGTRYLYDIGITNPALFQLTALNLVITPKVEIIETTASKPQRQVLWIPVPISDI